MTVTPTNINLDALERDAIAGKLRWQDAHALVSHTRHLSRQLAMQSAGIPVCIDLEDLAEQLLTPREIRRDENGHLQHPAMPSLGENACIAEFLGAFGLECNAIAMEDDDIDAWDRYTEAENMDCSFWTPSVPAGDGWVLLEIFESEDGPSALYARRKPDAPRHSRRANPSPFTAKVTRVKRRTGELMVQLDHQAPDRMYAGTQVTLHWRTEEPFETAPTAGATLTYPSELTEPLREVLSLMVWRSGQIAHVLRAGGAEIPKKAEAEQAHVLHWLIQLALEHGDEWWSRAYASLKEIQDALGSNKEPSNA